MRQLFYPVLVLVLVLLSATYWLVSRPPFWFSQFAASVSSSVGRSHDAKSATSSDRDSPFATRKVTPQAPVQSRARIEIPEPAPETALPTRTEVIYPIPVANEIVAGTARSAIVAKFGPPAALVTGADGGQLRERYIYLENATRKKIVIFLVNGVVTAAETMTQ